MRRRTPWRARLSLSPLLRAPETTSERRSSRKISPLGSLRGSFVAGDGQVRLVDVVHDARASQHRRERDSVRAKRKHASRLLVWFTRKPSSKKHTRRPPRMRCCVRRNRRGPGESVPSDHFEAAAGRCCAASRLVASTEDLNPATATSASPWRTCWPRSSAWGMASPRRTTPGGARQIREN